MFKRNRLIRAVFIASAICLLLEGVILRLLLCEASMLFEMLHLAVPAAACIGTVVLLRKYHDMLRYTANPLYIGISLFVLSLLVFWAGQIYLPNNATIPAYGAIFAIWGAVMILCGQKNRGLVGVAISGGTFAAAIGLSCVFDCTIGVAMSVGIAFILLLLSVWGNHFGLESGLLKTLVMASAMGLMISLVLMLALYYGAPTYWDEMMPDKLHREVVHHLCENAGLFAGGSGVYQIGSLEVSTNELFAHTDDDFLLLSALNSLGWWPIVLFCAASIVFLVIGLLISRKHRELFYILLSAVLLPVLQLIMYLLHQFAVSPIYMREAPLLSADGIGLFLTVAPLVVMEVSGVRQNVQENLTGDMDRTPGEVSDCFAGKVLGR